MKEAMEEALGDGQYSKQSKAVKYTCTEKSELELNCKINSKVAITFML